MPAKAALGQVDAAQESWARTWTVQNLPILTSQGLRYQLIETCFVPTPKRQLSIMPALRDPAVREKEASYLDISTIISSAQDLQNLFLAYIC